MRKFWILILLSVVSLGASAQVIITAPSGASGAGIQITGGVTGGGGCPTTGCTFTGPVYGTTLSMSSEIISTGMCPVSDNTDGIRMCYISGTGYLMAGVGDGITFGDGPTTSGGLPTTILGKFDSSGNFTAAGGVTATTPASGFIFGPNGGLSTYAMSVDVSGYFHVTNTTESLDIINTGGYRTNDVNLSPTQIHSGGVGYIDFGYANSNIGGANFFGGSSGLTLEASVLTTGGSASGGVFFGGMGGVYSLTASQNYGVYNFGTLSFSDSGLVFVAAGSVNSSLQGFVCQNTNTGSSASCDVIINANDATTTTHYLNFGKNNSNGGVSPFTNAHAAYIYDQDTEMDFGIGLSAGSGGAFNWYVNQSSTINMSLSSSGLLVSTLASGGGSSCLQASATGLISGVGANEPCGTVDGTLTSGNIGYFPQVVGANQLGINSPYTLDYGKTNSGEFTFSGAPVVIGYNPGSGTQFSVSGFASFGRNVSISGTTSFGSAAQVFSTGGSGQYSVFNGTASTSSTCGSAGATAGYYWSGTYWNGTASAVNSITILTSCSGAVSFTNPIEIMTISSSGSTGSLQFNVSGSGNFSGTPTTGTLYSLEVTGGNYASASAANLLVQQSGATAFTQGSANGNLEVLNSSSGFTGNFDCYSVNNAACVYSVNYQGNIASSSSKFNNITFTNPASATTLTLASGSTTTFTGAFADGITFSGAYTLTVPATGTAALLGTSNSFTSTNSFSAKITNTGNGAQLALSGTQNAASTNVFIANGTCYSGGTASTNYPFAQIGSGSAGTAWNASTCTYFSVNLASGATSTTTGYDLRVNGGSSLFNVNGAGGVYAATYALPSARKGTFVCTAAGSIVVTNSNFISTSDVIITMNTPGGTITTPPAYKTLTSGTSFTVLCGATDTSTYNYSIWN